MLAATIYSLALGVIQPIMGFSSLLPAILGGVLFALRKRKPANNRAEFSAFAYAASCYPATLMVSTLLGGIGFVTGKDIFVSTSFCLVSVGLSFLAINIPLSRYLNQARLRASTPMGISSKAIAEKPTITHCSEGACENQ